MKSRIAHLLIAFFCVSAAVTLRIYLGIVCLQTGMESFFCKWMVN